MWVTEFQFHPELFLVVTQAANIVKISFLCLIQLAGNVLWIQWPSPNPLTNRSHVWLTSKLQPFKCLHASHVACLIASILDRTNRLSRLGHLQHVSEGVGWRREGAGEAGARTQLNLLQHLLLQHVTRKIPLTELQDSAAAKAMCPEGSLVAFYESTLFLIDFLASPLGSVEKTKQKIWLQHYYV